MKQMQENILNTDKEHEAIGHICEGVKASSGKVFLARFAYVDGDNLVFITRGDEVIKNRRDLLRSLRVVV